MITYCVYLIDDYNGNSYLKYVGNSYFDCIVYTDHHKYSKPKNSHYIIEIELK